MGGLKGTACSLQKNIWGCVRSSGSPVDENRKNGTDKHSVKYAIFKKAKDLEDLGRNRHLSVNLLEE